MTGKRLVGKDRALLGTELRKQYEKKDLSIQAVCDLAGVSYNLGYALMTEAGTTFRPDAYGRKTRAERARRIIEEES